MTTTASADDTKQRFRESLKRRFKGLWTPDIICAFIFVSSFLIMTIAGVRVDHEEASVYLQQNCERTFPHHPEIVKECLERSEFRHRNASLPSPHAPVARPADIPLPSTGIDFDNSWSQPSADVLSAIMDALDIVKGYERAAKRHEFFQPDESHADVIAIQNAIDAGRALGRRMGKEMAPLKLEEYGRISPETLPKERLHYLLWTLEQGKKYVEPATQGKYYLCGSLWDDSRCLWDDINIERALQVGELVAECGQWEDRDTSTPCHEVALMEEIAMTTIAQLESLSTLLQLDSRK